MAVLSSISNLLLRIQQTCCSCFLEGFPKCDVGSPTPNWAPVCGVDGKTYYNECVATECLEVEVDCDGECPCNLGSDYESVPADICVTNGNGNCVDGNRYVNPSAAKCKGVEVECDGECPCEDDGSGNDEDEDKPCTVHLDYWPVCGVDGETYPNLSSIGCKGVEVQCEGDCPCDDAGSGNDENGSLIQFLPTQPPPPSWGPQL